MMDPNTPRPDEPRPDPTRPGPGEPYRDPYRDPPAGRSRSMMWMIAGAVVLVLLLIWLFAGIGGETAVEGDATAPAAIEGTDPGAGAVAPTDPATDAAPADGTAPPADGTAPAD